MVNTLGFIILRYVNSEKTDNYWKLCYDRIRKYYPENEIVIIDDESDKNFLTEKELYKTRVIESEYPRRGELLPYYYYLKYNFFDTAVILHDSVFLNSYIDFTVDKYKFLWKFHVLHHEKDRFEKEVTLINIFNDPKLSQFHTSIYRWVGCFGCMCAIKYEFLKHVNDRYDFSLLLDCIKTRYDRECFERVLACLLQKFERQTTMFGLIHVYVKWGSTYDEIINNSTLPIIKCWTGR